VDQALSIATACQSQVFAISVADVYPHLMERAPNVKDKLIRETESILKKVKEKAKEANIDCEIILHVGHQPHECIVQEAKDRKIDLIVMGTHGWTGLRKFIMGSVAQKVIGYTPCPVMIVPAKATKSSS